LFPKTSLAEGLLFQPCDSAESLRQLESVVEQTYRHTLDCPSVQGLRTVGEVLAGYRTVGQFDPARWLIVHDCRTNAAVGCLLLTEHTNDNHWELLYMGVTPEARGRGLGLEMVRHGQFLAGQSTVERVVLAVDAANSPAIAVYAAAGFETWDRRSVFLRAIGN
jgi:ribosomal protein S18 acetylase RimI-like enzyme